MILIKVDDFYNEFFGYINKHRYYEIKSKYYDLYVSLKYKKGFKDFKRDYVNLDSYVNKYNNNYLDSLECKTLDFVNGYSLDKYQRRIVLADEDQAIVIAGAGTGKSLTIVGKVLYLVKEKNVSASDILCISLTNEAVNNLKNNFKDRYNLDIDVFTFHKLALNILDYNGISYEIVPSKYLDYLVDYFFDKMYVDSFFRDVLIKLLGNYNDKDIINLKKLIKTFINLYKGNGYSVSYFLTILDKLKYKKSRYLVLIIFNVYLYYYDKLRSDSLIDFSDMINLSYEVLVKYHYFKKYKYIIIDEYQDTSLVKFKLIRELVKVCDAKLLVVGDDFQSIYRFTGCNLDVFLHFLDYFKYGKMFYLVNTYRNPQELIDISGKFICKNKKQVRKKLVSNKHINNPVIVYVKNNKVEALKDALNYIGNKDIMVLGRNNFDINSYIDDSFKLEDGLYKYRNIHFRYLTMHKSKGLESEVVVIINAVDSLFGIPCKIKDEKILKYVNNTRDYYLYEEERRLFYVGLTRTKSRVYILTTDKQSIFVKEILKYKNVVKKNKLFS